MWSRKELKNDAKKYMKRNYWAVVAVCFIMAVLSIEYIASMNVVTSFKQEKAYSGQVKNEMMSEADKQMMQSFDILMNEELHPVKGVFASLFTNVSKAQNTLSNVRRASVTAAEEHKAGALAVGILAVILSALYEIFIKAGLAVGERRFFMENRIYGKTRIGRIFFLFKERKISNTAWIMLVRKVYLFFWGFTIVGAFIKVYSYRMIPYILAENPEISRREAFYLSRQMMKGNKWRTFVLDLSFVWWYLLMLITLGAVGWFFMNPYMRSTEANLYVILRAEALESNIEGAGNLNDKALITVPDGQKYEYYPGTEGGNLHAVKPEVDYFRHYSLLNLILFFFTAAFIGWCWEVALHLIKDGIFVNRGSMFGPWLPIYGAGGIIALVALKKFIKNPAVTFILTMIICGAVEYTTSWYLELTKGIKWWDYSGYLLNLNGRICLEGLLTFAIAGCAFIYIIAPKLDDLYNKIPIKTKISICGMLAVLFGADVGYSHIHPNTGKGITDYSQMPISDVKKI